MKIIGFHTHDSYQFYFCSIPDVEMYHLTNEQHILWGAGARQKPTNLHDVPYTTLADVDFSKYDLCLFQNEQQYMELQQVPLPKIGIIHTVPYPLYNGDFYQRVIQDPSVKRLVLLTEDQCMAWRLPPLQVDVILPCIDVAEYPVWRDGSVEPIEAVLTVCNKLPECNWCCGWDVWRHNTSGLPRVLVGEGNEEASTCAVGFVDGDDLKDFYRRCAVYFHPSLHSPIGTALLEAMAVGMPIVSTDTWAAHTYLTNASNSINPKSAILSNVQPMLRWALIDVLKNPEAYREMGLAARRVIQEVFDPERFRMEWRIVLEEALA